VKLIAIRLLVDRDALLPSNGGPLSYDRSEIACQGLLSHAPIRRSANAPRWRCGAKAAPVDSQTHRCGHGAALGRRSRVAHMPIAAAAATRSLMCQVGDRNCRESN